MFGTRNESPASRNWLRDRGVLSARRPNDIGEPILAVPERFLDSAPRQEVGRFSIVHSSVKPSKPFDPSPAPPDKVYPGKPRKLGPGQKIGLNRLFPWPGPGSRGTRGAILLNARGTQTGKAMQLKRAFPRPVLFLRQLIVKTSFLDRDGAATHRGDHGGFAAHHPSYGVAWRQAFHERHPNQ